MQASTVDLLQVILRVLQVAHLEDPPRDELVPVPRPYKTEPSEPEKTDSKGLADFADFLKG